MKIHGTAKGGALSKKDFGVAFSSGGGGGLEISMENYDDPMSLQKDGSESYGYTLQENHLLIGKTIQSVSFFLKAGYGEITSGEISVYCGQNSSGTAGNVVIGTIDASSLSTDEFEWKEFSGTTDVVEIDDVIWIQYSSLGDQRAEIRYYGNSPSGLGLYANFWGRDGGSLPASNTEGTTDAGPTLINWQQTNAQIGYAPSLDEADYFHPMRIKITYTE